MPRFAKTIHLNIIFPIQQQEYEYRESNLRSLYQAKYIHYRGIIHFFFPIYLLSFYPAPNLTQPLYIIIFFVKCFDSLILKYLVDCKLGPWKEGTCSATCGASSIKTMTRDIIQKPSYGGKQCEGPLTKTVNCKLTPCPGTLLVEYMDSNSSIRIIANRINNIIS